MLRTTILVVAALSLAGCVNQAQIVGQTASGDEVFTGGSFRSASGGGSLVVTSNRGRSCAGRFVYDTPRTGKGVFRCSDGQSGPFEFVSDGVSGNGVGVIGGRRFTFMFN